MQRTGPPGWTNLTTTDSRLGYMRKKTKFKKQVTVKYTGGDTPDAIITMVDSDPSTRKEGHVIYSDYKNCGISVMESLGHQCTLWVAYKNRYSYPESCKRMHRKLCGEGVSLFDKEFCDDI
ncbi:uncharacterized protein LOC119173359 isoform X2 [Rhipicephalus microplus]|uniref:uncharacterized protein LOC119173359 isoform X2 n=1 Tax=Rhipicephalus microplus TaxID=6941 RepID=UPI003F6CF945